MTILFVFSLLSIISVGESAVLGGHSGAPLPEPCLFARNFTESWRLDHDGKQIKPGGPHSWNGYACDLHKDIQWFRFTGAAGKLCYVSVKL